MASDSSYIISYSCPLFAYFLGVVEKFWKGSINSVHGKCRAVKASVKSGVLKSEIMNF
jgi:hypothetical protein